MPAHALTRLDRRLRLVRAALANNPVPARKHGDPFRIWRAELIQAEQKLRLAVMLDAGTVCAETASTYRITCGGINSKSEHGWHAAIENWCKNAAKHLAARDAA